MTCSEFQEVLPDVIDGGRNGEHEAHLKSCAECAGLVSDLNLISQQARLLRADEDPSPRVWNSIEIALRQDGLIRPSAGPSLVASRPRRWALGWLVPIAAAALVAFGVMEYQTSRVPMANQPAPGTTTPTVLSADATDDEMLLQTVASTSPAMLGAYQADIQNVNAYIRDAEQSVKNDPNDEEAQQYLMSAYQQRNMVYEMAMDRTLP